MKIGLIDVDLWFKPSKKILNVDLMKFGNYYEKNNCQVEALTPEDNIYYYDKIIVFSNYYKLRYYEKKIEKHPNVNYYGLTFSNYCYIPTYIKEIDYEEPKVTCYNRLLYYYYEKGIYTKEEIIKMKNTVWTRIIPNQNPIDYYKILTGQKLLLADSNLPKVENSIEIFNNLKIYNRYVKFIFPQRVDTQEEFDRFKILFEYKFINFTMLIDTYNLENFKKIINDNYEWILLHSTKITYGFGNDIENRKEQFYREDFDLSFKKILFLKEKKIKVSHTSMFYNSNSPLTFSFYRTMSIWSKDNINTKKNFNQTFIAVNRKEEDIIQMYFSFLNKNPSYYHLLNKKFKAEEEKKIGRKVDISKRFHD